MMAHTSKEARPLFFGPDERPLFGWLHLPAAGLKGALVVCNPFGYEAIYAHRSIRHFAETAAKCGFVTLRFDYEGTGDSAGSNAAPLRFEAWQQSVHSAIETVKAHSGVHEVWLL